ncbi:hypothetical protein [Ideonella sp. A 288]|uniref:hypothetical protein n=1 Tax=Ideonella sp. A 288 TaxID=1962181 RepID=UPI000B4B9214|nr:hypothetical protein [Ideonella sp. A 288]
MPPRAGHGMARVKHAAGALVLAPALWLASLVLPGWTVMVLAAWLLLAAAVSLGTFDPMPHATPGATFARGLGLGLATLAMAQLVGVAMGGRDPLQPLQRTAPMAAPASATPATPAPPGPASSAPLSPLPMPSPSSAARAPAA